MGNFWGSFRKSVYDSARCIIPVHYSRYVDDIFYVSNSLEYVKMVLCFLNNLHPNLKSTCEIGPNKLAFFDTIF